MEKTWRITKHIEPYGKSGIINLSEGQTSTRKVGTMINVSFNTSSTAFCEEIEGVEYFNFNEVENIFDYIMLSIKEGDNSGKIRDSKGNVIGGWQWI